MFLSTMYPEYITRTVMFAKTLIPPSIKSKTSLGKGFSEYRSDSSTCIVCDSVLSLILCVIMDDQEEYMVEIDPSRESYLNNREGT